MRKITITGERKPKADTSPGSNENVHESSNVNDLISGHGPRQKLQNSFNLKQFVKTGEGEFEIEVRSQPAGKVEEESKNFLRGMNFNNILVEASDGNEELLMFENFNALGGTMSNVTEDGGIKKKIDKAGQQGKFPPPHAKAWIHYTAMVEDYDEPVDKTDRNGRPRAFKIGRGEVIPVLDIGVPTMELKEVAKFLAKPAYAYGELGLVDRVPKNATVLFIIELVDFMEVTPVNSVFKLSPEDRAQLDYKEIHKVGLEMKADGNLMCKQKNWVGAISRYRKGVKILDHYLTVDKNIEKSRNDLLFILYTNLAQCYLNTEDYGKAIDVCQQALDLPPDTEGNKCKAYYRQGKAQFNLGRFEEAKKLGRLALNLEPSNSDVRKFYDQLCKRIEQDQEEEKILSKKMFSGLNLK